MKALPEVGQVVRSLRGRDQGRFFMVFARIDSEYVLTVDGVLRKLNRPKKKKVRHLSCEPVYFHAIREKLEAGEPVTDSQIRRALKDAGYAASDREKEA